jgi:hypothetical protein
VNLLRTSTLAAFFIVALSACGGSSQRVSPAEPAAPTEVEAAPAAGQAMSGEATPAPTDVTKEPGADAAAGGQACGGCPKCAEKAGRQSGSCEGGEGCKGCKGGHRGKKAEMMKLCKAMIGQADLTVRDTPDGVAIVFTARDPANVADVRARAAEMAEMHRRHGGHKGKKHGDHKGKKHGDHKGKKHGDHKGKKHGRTKMPDATIVVTDAAGGAEVVFTPTDPAQLGALKERVAEHAKTMTDGGCEMMGKHGSHVKPGGDAPKPHD